MLVPVGEKSKLILFIRFFLWETVCDLKVRLYL